MSAMYASQPPPTQRARSLGGAGSRRRGSASGTCLSHEELTTQGHVLRTAHFVATLAVEAAVHHLDLTVEVPAAPPPTLPPRSA